MHRRHFLQSLGAAGAAGLAASSVPAQPSPAAGSPPRRGTATRKKLLFWDLWHLDRMENLQLRQGQAQWRPEGTYVDPVCFGLNSWPTVYRDEDSGRWRMLYSARWKPYTLLVAESDDGVRWSPLPTDDIRPGGDKLAPHHLFTLESGSGGAVYVDPQATGGYRFRVYCHQQQEPVTRRAAADPAHRWHEIAARGGNKRYVNEEFTLVSRDGLHWEADLEAAWGLPDWHPEPPIFGFYNAALGRHMMTVRPGWGDRRVCLQSSADLKAWSGPELLLQPDPTDTDLVQFYGMPIFPYDIYYVGLLWVFHCSSSSPVRSFNQFVGPLDCQLAYSYDGVRFFRGVREPFLPLNPDPEHGMGAIQPSCLVETDEEIRIYSESSKIYHGRSRHTPRARERELYAILLHTLRKDGFMYLASRGDWAGFTTKPLALFDAELTLNAKAPFGEVRCQLTDVESRPLPGFTFDDCRPLVEADQLAWPLRWREKKLDDVLGQPVRLEVRLRGAELYGFRGNWHFLDAQDRWMLADGKPIDTRRFDF